MGGETCICYGSLYRESVLEQGLSLSIRAVITIKSQTDWLLNSKHLFLTVLKAETSKIKMSADLRSAEGPPPGS